MAKQDATYNKRCGNCINLDETQPGMKGYTNGFECSLGKGIKAPGQVAPDECFLRDPAAKPFHKHLSTKD